MDHEDLVPGVNLDILNTYEEGVEDGEELFGEHGELVKEIEEANTEEVNFKEAENVPEDSDSEGEVEINALIKEFNNNILPEGEELLNNNNEEIEEEAEVEEEEESNVQPIQTRQEPERLNICSGLITRYTTTQQKGLNTSYGQTRTQLICTNG